MRFYIFFIITFIDKSERKIYNIYSLAHNSSRGDCCMNKLICKLERKFGKYAINNLALYIIGAYVIGYIFQFIGASEAINLNPYRILHGEIWRVITWIFIPPRAAGGGLDFIFVIIMLFFYYSLAQTLEQSWGAFRFNLYIFSGIIMTIIGAFVFYGISELTVMKPIVESLEGIDSESVSRIISQASSDKASSVYQYKNLYYQLSASYFSTYYINLSIFLAFAACFPNMQVMLYFVIPIKIKWLAYLDVAVLAFEIYSYITAGLWVGVVAIIASLLNFVVFFFATRNMQKVSPKEIRRKKTYKKQVESVQKMRIHRCTVCGRTSADDNTLEFRFCSKCDGNHEYCQNHLFTHEHIKYQQ